jgi:hypothetical protein
MRFLHSSDAGEKMGVNETVHQLFIDFKKTYDNALKQGDALSTLFSNFALEYAIRKVQENQVGLKLNGTHWFQDYADDVNLL